MELNPLEILAAIFGGVHVYYLTKQKIWCWPIGIVAVVLSAFVFYQSRLYSDMILYSIYVLLNFYGWYAWSKGQVETDKLSVSWLSKYGLLITLSVITLGTFLWGYFMQKNTDAELVYIDAFTTVSSLTAQFLLTRKKIDNWIIWLVINSVAFGMYIYKGLYFFAALAVIYFILCAMGLRDWKKDLKSAIPI